MPDRWPSGEVVDAKGCGEEPKAAPVVGDGPPFAGHLLQEEAAAAMAIADELHVTGYLRRTREVVFDAVAPGSRR